MRKIVVLSLVVVVAMGVAMIGGSESVSAKPDPKQIQAERVKRGQYLVTIGGCNDCHTPFKMGPNGPEPDMSRALSGHPEALVMPPAPKMGEGPWLWAGAATNTAFAGPWGVSYARNLTPEELTGTGIWTEEQFIKTLRTGRHWGVSRPILPPMPWQNYAQATDEDLKSIFAYLRTLEPIKNQVPDAVLAPPPAAPVASPAAPLERFFGRTVLKAEQRRPNAGPERPSLPASPSSPILAALFAPICLRESDCMAEALATDKHPRGLYVLFGTEMWERFSFYTVNAMLALYLRDSVQGFSFSSAQAATVQSWYLMFVYFTPLIGGLIADLFLGFRKAIIVGGVFFIAGHALLAVPDNLMIVYAALACLVIGNGFFKPNVSSMVGNLYTEGSHLKDKAYLIFYMGINVGAALAPIVAGFIQPRWGFHPAFFMGAIGMLISMALFMGNRRHVAHADRIRGKQNDFMREDGSHGHQDAVATAEDLPPVLNEEARNMQAIPEWKRIMALIVIFIIVIVFWMIFHQNSLTLTFWADDHTEWTFIRAGGILSNAINAIWIVVLSLPLAGFWTWLDKRGLEPSTPTKMMYGMILTGLSMIVLYFAAQSHGYTAPVFRVEKVDQSGTWVSISPEAVKHLGISIPATPIEVQKGDTTVSLDAWRVNHTGPTPRPNDFVRIDSHDGTGITTGQTTKASLWWLILMYGVISLGELMLSPMGLALVSKVAPIRMRGLMMGGWFTATAIGNKLTAIGGYWDLWSHTKFFMVLALMAFATSVILFLLLRPLRKAMPGV